MTKATEPRLLVVGEGPSSLLELEPMLVPLGYRLVRASMEQALRLLPTDEFVAIVVDLPGSAAEAIEAAKAFGTCRPSTDVPILFAGPNRLGSGNLQSYTEHGIEFLVKPLDKESLFRSSRSRSSCFK